MGQITNTSEVVFSKVPWLDPNNATDIQSVDKNICFTRIELQKVLGKSDSDVQLEAAYNQQEKLLIGCYTSYKMVAAKARENVGGSTGGTSTGGNKILKKAKADVTEAEFTVPTKQQGGTLIDDIDGILAALKEETCSIASICGISLPICIGNDPEAAYAPVSPRMSCGLTGCC